MIRIKQKLRLIPSNVTTPKTMDQSSVQLLVVVSAQPQNLIAIRRPCHLATLISDSDLHHQICRTASIIVTKLIVMVGEPYQEVQAAH